MGIDCTFTIPAPAQLRDVADVLAALLGCPVERRPLGDGSTYAHVAGVTFQQYGTPDGDPDRPVVAYAPSLPSCVSIEIATPDGPRSFLYHYEWDAMGNRGIMPRATAANIALCVAACDFFGGSVDFNDCDDVGEDYRQPVREDIHASDGQPWQAFQDRKLAVQPLTPSDIARFSPVAAY